MGWVGACAWRVCVAQVRGFDSVGQAAGYEPFKFEDVNTGLLVGDSEQQVKVTSGKGFYCWGCVVGGLVVCGGGGGGVRRADVKQCALVLPFVASTRRGPFPWRTPVHRVDGALLSSSWGMSGTAALSHDARDRHLVVVATNLQTN